MCGKVRNRDDLRSVRLMGAVGVAHSSSPKIDEFLNGPDAGNPEIFDRPK